MLINCIQVHICWPHMLKQNFLYPTFHFIFSLHIVLTDIILICLFIFSNTFVANIRSASENEKIEKEKILSGSF